MVLYRRYLCVDSVSLVHIFTNIKQYVATCRGRYFSCCAEFQHLHIWIGGVGPALRVAPPHPP